MTKSSKHWYPRYSGDYRAKTAGLTLTQHGAYTLLLDEYYNTGKPLSTNVDVLYRICSALVEDEQRAIDYILSKFFNKTDVGYVNKRADEELARRSDISDKRKSAVNSRYTKPLQTTYKTSTIVPTNVDTSTSTSTSTSIKKKEGGENFVLPLPEWLPLDDWHDYLEMRDKKGKGKATNRAKQLVIIKLDELRKSGHDPGKVLQQSIINGWTSVFQLKEGGNGYANGHGGGGKSVQGGAGNRDTVMSALYKAGDGG